MASKETFGWYGLGSMGLGMALNFQKHLAANGLEPLHYSNRTLSRGEPLQEAGAVLEQTFEDLISKSSVVFTMITNDDVLDNLVTSALESESSLKGKTWVDTSTIHPETCVSVSERLRQQGATFIASPVFGASPVAAAGKLIFCMAGPTDVIDGLRPYILNVMARSIIDMGENVGKSSLLKISGNMLVIGFQEIISEAHIFAEKTGLGTQQMEEFISSMFGPVIESYSNRITSGAYAPQLDTQPGFAAALASKDLNHAIRLANDYGLRLPTVETALSRIDAARGYAGESLDSTALYGAARLEAGLPFWSENSRQSN